MKKTIVISLGGSLIAPDEIDVKFLKNFRSAILPLVKSGTKVVLVCGGGKVCRRYQDSLNQLTKPTDIDLDWLGIYCTRSNAKLVQLMFAPYSAPEIVTDPEASIKLSKNVLVAGGWRPGRSTDDVATLLAGKLKADQLINLSNVDFVYDKDPRKHTDAKKILSLDWAEYKSMFVQKWQPGSNVPFDPTAAKRAADLGLRVIIASGNDINNFKKILTGKKFNGTVIG